MKPHTKEDDSDALNNTKTSTKSCKNLQPQLKATPKTIPK